MSEEVEGGLLLLSTQPKAHELTLRLFRNRGVPVAVSSEGASTREHLQHHPALVLVDLNHGPGLDRENIEAINLLRKKTMVLGIHDGNLDRFAKQLDALVVNAYCNVRNWRTIVDLAASTVHASENVSQH